MPKKNNFSQEKLDRVKKLLIEGNTSRQIYTNLMKGEISGPTIIKYLGNFIKENNKKILENKYKIIVDEYNKNPYIICICKKLKVSQKSVENALKYYNIEKVDVSSNNQHARKNIVNESYFEKIDSSEKAYYLGLMYADGVVHMRTNPCKNIVKISLTEKDAYILEKLNKETNFNRPLKRYIYSDNRGKPYLIWNLNSKKMCLDLIDKKCFQRKSLILELPFFNNSFLNEKYYSVFLRGFFDGDGSSGSINNLDCNFTSSHIFCKQLKIFLENNLFIKARIKKYKNFSMLYICKKENMIKLYKYLYSDNSCKIFLKRKKDNFESYLDSLQNKKRKRKIDFEIMKQEKILL